MFNDKEDDIPPYRGEEMRSLPRELQDEVPEKPIAWDVTIILAIAIFVAILLIFG